ncbi:hypothetical protein ANTRET_LOCUS3606 [Anthophora retusa]
MSINVTVNGNHLNIRRGRMVLSDLDQIKKNERDRRRRLRLEQVRQQSKEISDRLLERTKNIAKEELKKLENNEKLSLRQIYNGKIMEIQQKYQEDMADIGQAHISAALEPDSDALIEEKERRNNSVASKRGKEAMKQIKNIQQKETVQQEHQERLRQIREVENLRSSLIAKLPKKATPEKDTVCVSVQDEQNKQEKSVKKRTKKVFSKKSPGKITKTYIKVTGSDFKTRSPLSKCKARTIEINPESDSPVVEQQSSIKSVLEPLPEHTAQKFEYRYDDKTSRKEVKNISVQVDKAQRYNPEDYVQGTSNSSSSDTSNSCSDDSSYFSDSGEQYMNKEIKTTKYVKCPVTAKVHLYDHSKHQSNMYNQPIGAVEKIHAWDEPSAIDLAQEIEQAQTAETHLLDGRKHSVQKRGVDAALRERVRRDYQALMQNLDHLASEERKLKISQIERYPKDVHLQEERRKILRDQHKKKLNHALQILLNEESSEQCTIHPIERQITLTPKENDKNVDTRVVWEEPYCFGERTETDKILQNTCKDNKTSREEQILNMLKKVEKQKRLLLQEFGTDLPNDIFNASVKSLLERDKSVQTQSNSFQDIHIQKPLSPEIKVITASCDKNNEKNRTEECDTFIKKVEIAVQTTTEDKNSIVQDKSTQVELVQEKKGESDSVNDKAKTVIKHYPIEPKIRVIRHEADSSESTSSDLTNVIIDTDKRTKTTPRKKKNNVKLLKQIPSKMFHKSSSTRIGKSSSPIKKLSKSLSKLQYTSTKKCTDADDVPNKKIKMCADKSRLNDKVKQSPVAKIAVDVSTQSTQIYSTGTQEQSIGKPQWIHSKSKSIQIKDISDTSTSFASPPPIKPRDILEVLSNNISILEMLDSSANESMRLLRRDISPVSTPETPSPRTMKLPSNIPHPERIKKLLGYAYTDSQGNDNNTQSSIKNDYSTSSDLSEYQQNGHLSSESMAAYSKVPISLEFCLCNNPECRQIHAKFDEIRNYALKNCPQILQKYEDLQVTCAERIVSLTNLIEKVRNEQKGMEFSLIDQHDETSLMQLPPPKLVTNDLQSIRKLVENIEAIHNQLAKTLIESQKIIKNKAINKKETDQFKKAGRVSSTNDDVPNITTHPVEPKAEVEKAKIKPKIISEEKVNIPLSRFKVQKSPQRLTTSTPERDTWLTPKQYEEEVIEQLSKEILEQSEGFNNNLITSKEIYNSTVKYSTQMSIDAENLQNNTSSKVQTNDVIMKRHFNKESKNIKNFVPLLTDVPKVSKTIDSALHTNGRNKPPVSLLSGPYRAEIESSGHELSTIIEFDTPDTINKSQSKVKSPLVTKKVAETQITKSAVAVNPSEHITTSPKIHNQCSEKLCNTSVTKLFSMTSAQTVKDDTSKILKNIGNRNLAKNKDEEKEDVVQLTINKKLQCGTVNQESLQMEKLQSFCYTSTDVNNEYKDNKDKITSTSSNSFSELSGVSQIASTPSSTMLKYASSPEEMEMALKKLGLGWAITTLKKTREASALSSSSNSDVTPINTVKRIISPVKKQFDSNYGLPDFSDVSSISIKEASKSTEQAVLLKGRTSTPKLQNTNSNSDKTNTSNTNISENFQEPDDGLIIPNISLIKTKSYIKKLEDL